MDRRRRRPAASPVRGRAADGFLGRDRKPGRGRRPPERQEHAAADADPLLSRGPERTQIALVDYRRTLLEEAAGPAVAAYAGSRVASVNALGQILPQITARLPGADVTIEQLRDRSWWQGPEWYLILDDYELVGPNALPGVAELVAQGRDIGFHLVIARRVGGSSRTMFEPLSQQLRDLGTQGLILSGSPQEGVLLGNQRAQHLPPGRGILVQGRLQPEVVQTPRLSAE